ncbi:MAG TPA: alpha/beta hydrolase [Pseudolabrys sp.]|nr:alpha/beta hydrolase [Pseudolabrys sp.]
MATLKSLIILAILAYAGALALMYLFQRSLMYFPDPVRTSPAAAGLPRAEELILHTADGETLIAWHVPPQGTKPVVIYFHGNAGALNLRAGRFGWLVGDGFGLVALSYRGYGGSSGKPSEAGMLLDASAAYDFAAARYPPERIVLWGESLGTGVAVALAAERRIGGLILDAPFTSAADIGAAAYPFVHVRWFIKDTFRSDLRIGRAKAPILVLHGEQDRIVPIAFGEKLFALANEPKQMVRFPSGGHVDLDDHGAAKVVKTFLNNLPMCDEGPQCSRR